MSHFDPLYEDPMFLELMEQLEVKTPWDKGFYRGWESLGVYQLLRQALPLRDDCF